MATQDLSRHLHQPEKRYSGLRMQQGRVILDADFNEGEMLDDEGQRVVVRDVIGPHGSPDNGFLITSAMGVDYDFTIASGTYYVGGLRFSIGATPTSAPTPFGEQPNWLQFGVLDEPALPTVPLVSRRDLVYVVGWEQTVSAVEDAEILEQALGGPDTSVRLCRLQRVYVKTGVPEGCAAAYQALQDQLTAGGHSFDALSGELLSGARLTVDLELLEADLDLCKPAVENGYAGAENQAIRVQLIGGSRFLWSYDNASPLYRVGVSELEEDEATVTFMTLPRDQAHIPLVGQILEILPQGARLPNKECIADHPIAGDIGTHVLARVIAPYDPTTQTVAVVVEDAADLAAMIDWTDDQDEGHRYFFARMWNPGDAGTGAFGIAFTADTAVSLPGTGLTVTFNKDGIVGDHWIIAARPSTPETTVPWDLRSMAGAAPHGPRRFYAPLGIFDWTIVLEPRPMSRFESHSCRRTFRPLTQLGRCCTVSVGDGNTSFGDFTSINAAIASLGSAGGKVCVLPGVYEERITIYGRENIVVEGCGDRSIISTPDDNDTTAGLIAIGMSKNITLRCLRIEATGQYGVTVVGGIRSSESATDIVFEKLTVIADRPDVEPVSFEDLWVPTDGPSPFSLCTIAAQGVTRMKVLDCTLTQRGDELSPAANVLFWECAAVSMRGCKVLTPSDGPLSYAWGGVHIAADCLDIELRDNEIFEGIGYGVTFGSVEYSLGEATYRPDFNSGGADVLLEGDDCPGGGGGINDRAPPGREEPWVSLPGAPIRDVRIVDNLIHGMGGSGISVLGFWKLGSDTVAYPMIEVHDLLIEHNRIEGNYQRPAEDVPDPLLVDIIAFGGVVLADSDNLRVINNVIRRNGVDFLHPVCGIYLLHGEGVSIEGNQIRENGPLIVSDSAMAGNRAGVALQWVGRRVLPDGPSAVEGSELEPAARVRGNTVLQPAGRALQVYGMGPMFVEGNHLASEGLVLMSSTIDYVHCVDIQNLGQSSDLIASGSIPADIAFLVAAEMTYAPGSVHENLRDGRVLFADNQVRFNPRTATASANFLAVTRLQSYGDIACLGNQFFTKLQSSGEILDFDTVIVGFSVRVLNNRWEDPVTLIPGVAPLTTKSAFTLGYMNTTTLNQASRCIEANISGFAPTANLYAPTGSNVIYDEVSCTPTPGFTALLLPPTETPTP